LVQVLVPAELLGKLPKQISEPWNSRGALIFGQNMAFKWIWNDFGSPEQVLALPSEEDEKPFLSNGVEANASTGIAESLTCNDYTVGIVCALDKELLAVRALFDKKHSNNSIRFPPEDTNHYSLGRIEQHNVVAACLPSGTYGTNSAAEVVSNLKRTFTDVRFCLLVGIGGGVPSEQDDIRLGDVVVSLPTGTYSGVIQYDFGKALRDGTFERVGRLDTPPPFLRTAISSLQSDPFLPWVTAMRKYLADIAAIAPAYKYPGVKHDRLFASTYVHSTLRNTCNHCNGPELNRLPRLSQHPTIHYGLIASGNQVMKNSYVRDRLRKRYPILCFEMEAAGVMNIVPTLVIRGICDYSDSHKNKIWQEYAAATAAAYAKVLLSVVTSFERRDDTRERSETEKVFIY
jgi:nucleoside phosphorylase